MQIQQRLFTAFLLNPLQTHPPHIVISRYLAHFSSHTVKTELSCLPCTFGLVPANHLKATQHFYVSQLNKLSKILYISS